MQSRSWARLDLYSPEEVEALARAPAGGLQRDRSAIAVGPEEAAARSAEDRQDGELVRMAACAGLRRGDLVALRWRDVDFTRRKLAVRRAIQRRRRGHLHRVPARRRGAAARPGGRCTEPPLVARRLHESDDYMFANRLGRRLDGSALRRRVERARDAARRAAATPFHDLRHTYGSQLVAAGIDLASVKAAMGHSRITTTER